MNISKLKNSNFLTKEDVGDGVLLTIREIREENVAMPGAPEQFKTCIHFEEVEKPMVLNITNGQIIAKAIGSEETDDWTGHKIVLFHDPNISYQGKITGGIRARAPRVQKPGAAKPAAAGAVRPKPAARRAPEPVPEPEQDPDADTESPF